MFTRAIDYLSTKSVICDLLMLWHKECVCSQKSLCLCPVDSLLRAKHLTLQPVLQHVTITNYLKSPGPSFPLNLIHSKYMTVYCIHTNIRLRGYSLYSVYNLMPFCWVFQEKKNFESGATTSGISFFSDHEVELIFRLSSISTNFLFLSCLFSCFLAQKQGLTIDTFSVHILRC